MFLNCDRIMYSAINVARYIIAYEHQQNRCISNLRLQVLLYFVQAKYIASVGAPIFRSPIEALAAGPVVLEAYQKYRIFGGATIPASSHTSDIKALREDDAAIINPMLDYCASYYTTDLLNCVKKQKPFIDARSNWLSKRITTRSMLDYFWE